jgi:4-aminobutyrate aminotransferase/(S)-3-amino-2-methylpropionate transaminase
MEAISTGTFDTPAFSHGKGAWLYDAQGEAYFDGTAGSGAISLGYGHSRLLGAVHDQLDKLVHTGCKFNSDVRARLADKLCELVPFTDPAVLYTVIGTEAVEASLKVARAYTGRRAVIGFEHAYHGKSAGSLPLTWRDAFKGYSLLPERGIYHDKLPDIDENGMPVGVERALESFREVMDTANKNGEAPAAVIIEPVQITEGVIAPGRQFLEGLIDIARENGTLVIFDEIYTGIGRCGSLFYSDTLSKKPDLLVLGKSLGSGFPISVVTGERAVMNALPAAVQTSTYSGSPLSCAAAEIVLDVVTKENLPQQVQVAGTALLSCLRDLQREVSAITAARGVGLVAAFDCVDEAGQAAPHIAKAIIGEARERRLLLFGGGRYGNSVKIVPPLLMSDEEQRFLLETLRSAAYAVLEKMPGAAA